MYDKKILKYDISIARDVIKYWFLVIIISEILLAGTKPPEEIIDIDRLRESKNRNSNKLSNINIINVKKKYKIKIFKNCFFISYIFIDIKDEMMFFNFISKTSITNIRENKKWSPPNHWEVDLHKIILSSKILISLNIVNPVEVNPDIDSK